MAIRLNTSNRSLSTLGPVVKAPGSTGGGLATVSADTNPALGGDLDTLNYVIRSDTDQVQIGEVGDVVNIGGRREYRDYTGSLTGNGTTTLATIPVGSGETISGNAYITAMNATDECQFNVYFAVRNIAGVMHETGNQIYQVVYSAGLACPTNVDIDITVSGTNLIIQVQNVSITGSIDWYANIEMVRRG